MICPTCDSTGFRTITIGAREGQAVPDLGSLNLKKAWPWIKAQMEDLGARPFLLSQMSTPLTTSDPEAWAQLVTWLLADLDIDRKSTAWTDGHSQGKGQRTKAVPCDCAEGREIAAGWERTKQKKLDKLNKKQGRRSDGFTPAGGAF